MILVAITGTVCSGKSFICDIIAKLGYPIFSCDDEIHKILKQENILEKIKEIFPQVIIENSINKKALAEIIFENQEAREKLEKTLYPKLFDEERKFIQRHKKKNIKILFFEVPLLYEKNLQSKYDNVIVTHAPKSVLIERAITRGIDRSLFQKIFNTQMSVSEKIDKADYVINTDISNEKLCLKIKKIIDSLVKV
ncbi:MAG: dephospho-CoA kinase [Rickettsiales bacterium]|nr:dephospho-CoA kinase [Rickettsiales bacterium]